MFAFPQSSISYLSQWMASQMFGLATVLRNWQNGAIKTREFHASPLPRDIWRHKRIPQITPHSIFQAWDGQIPQMELSMFQAWDVQIPQMELSMFQDWAGQIPQMALSMFQAWDAQTLQMAHSMFQAWDVQIPQTPRSMFQN